MHSVFHLVLLARSDMLEINRQFQGGLPAKGAEGMEIWNRGSKALAATVLTGLRAIQSSLITHSALQVTW